MLNRITDEYGIVCKINVTDIDMSIEWYKDTLGLKNDIKFYEFGCWAQLNCPGIKNFALGLSAHDKPVGSNGTTVTFMVSDVEKSRSVLKERQIAVSEIVDTGHGVKLVHFSDPDGNILVLRQNSNGIGNIVGDY